MSHASAAVRAAGVVVGVLAAMVFILCSREIILDAMVGKTGAQSLTNSHTSYMS